MSKTALIDAVKAFDVEKVQAIFERKPALRTFQSEKGFNLLQMCCARLTNGDRAAAGRQLRLAKWVVANGFDPLVTHTTKPGEDGEEDPAASCTCSVGDPSSRSVRESTPSRRA